MEETRTLGGCETGQAKISGVYGYPIEKAAAIALRTMKTFLREDPFIDKIVLCAFGNRDYQIYVKGRAFGSPLARGLKPRASTAEADPRAKPGAPTAVDTAKELL